MQLFKNKNDIEVITIIDNMELLYSSILHISTDTIILKIKELEFIIVFSDEGNESRYQTVAEDKRLKITLYKHNSALGQGLLKPLEIAKVNKRSIYITYFVKTISAIEKNRIVELSLYIGCEEK